MFEHTSKNVYEKCESSAQRTVSVKGWVVVLSVRKCEDGGRAVHRQTLLWTTACCSCSSTVNKTDNYKKQQQKNLDKIQHRYKKKLKAVDCVNLLLLKVSDIA